MSFQGTSSNRIKTLFIIIPVFILFILGCLNIYKKIQWEEPSDGVTWQKRKEGLTAIRVEKGSPAYLAGINKGDILYSINLSPMENPIDVAKQLWIAESSNQKVRYEIVREGFPMYPSFFVEKKRTHLLYFYLALIGMTAFVIGLTVFINARKSLSPPYIFFFLVTMAFFSFQVFSPTGHLDTLDSLFYWLDIIPFLFFPPLLLHFFAIFPKRKKINKKQFFPVYLFYFPATLLLLGQIFFHLPDIFQLGESFTYDYFMTLEKLNLFHLTLFTFIALAVIIYDSYKVTNLIIKKQLKWVAYGLGIGFIPFAVFYAFPYFSGSVPSKLSEATIVLHALIPLAFVYSISRYKLMDLEVLLKKAVTLIISYMVIATVYFIVTSQTKISTQDNLSVLLLGIMAIILGATLFTPLKNLIQSLLDRAIYRRSYHYRKTLLSISEELSRERDLDRLSRSLLDLIANALAIEHIALLLPSDNQKGVFYVQRSRKQPPSRNNHIHMNQHLYRRIIDEEFVSFLSLTERKNPASETGAMTELNFFHLLPLKVEGNLIGCLAMGKKTDDTFLNSEDWELLRTISSPMALTLENAYLYDQVHARALELERLKDYSENIIESLTVGVAVTDKNGHIIGWNRVMEETFLKKKVEVTYKNLAEALGEQNYSAVFPSDTQKGFRLLSEISLNLPTGENKIFDIAKTPLLDNKMNPYGTVLVFEDTTEKMSLQQQLLTSEKLASVGLLSAGVAHEINTPLTGISSYIQMLQKKLSDSSHSRILNKIEAQTDRVGRIVKNLLNFARNPSDSMFHQININENIQSIISLIDYKLKHMNIDLNLELMPMGPVWGHGEKLQQVFINIILNALDAMPDGGMLKIRSFQSGQYAAVRIEDTGTGIKSQHMPNIFDPFFTTKGIGKGTGLGLSISYAIVKEHAGHIDVKSYVQKGTVFTVYLPVQKQKKNSPESITREQEHHG
ncbi:MAG: ATP-binding protein [Candidatus Aminicenantes bacterium]